jgi:hypothetical protein
MVRSFAPLGLDDVERGELTSLASRRSTALRSSPSARSVVVSIEVWRHYAPRSQPKPFRWTKSADDIPRSIERFCSYNLPTKT